MTIIRRFLKSTHASAFVELSVALPFLTALTVGTTDFARAFYSGIELSNAARAGAQYGAASTANAQDSAGITSAATNAAPNLTGVSIAISPTTPPGCQCATDSGSFSATSPSANNCTAAVTTACPTAGTHRVMTVTVTATRTFNTIARYPGIPSSLSISRTATMRVTE